MWRQAVLLKQLQVQLKKARAEGLLMESRVREDIGREFSELFSEMQNDYNERLAREREILEERAERRLEIFKNLINRMAAGPSREAEAVVTQTFIYCPSVIVVFTKFRRCYWCRTFVPFLSYLAGVARGDEDEEKRTLLFELQEMSSEVSRLEKQVGDLQRTAELAREKSSREKEQLQGALTALQKELRAREEALAVLEGPTLGKEEALASLKEERKKRDEAVAALGDLKQSNEKMLESFEEERKGKEKAMAALETERRAKEEAMAALAALHEEKSSREEEERKEISRLAEQRRHEEADALRQELGELSVKLETAEHQVTSNAERAEKAFVQLQAAQAQVDEQAKAIQEKCSQIQTLIQEAERLKQEVHASAVSQGANEKLQEEVSQFQKSPAEERQKTEAKHREVLHLEHELAEVKQQLAHKQLVLDQQLELWSQKEASSKQEVEELQKKLKQQGEMPSSSETERMLEEQDGQMEEKLAELQKELLEKDAQVTSLKKSLQEAQEQREEDECQAVQEARRKEVERRRELLAAAHEAIAQKEAELKKRDEDISRLKENAKQDSEKVKSLSVDLQRKEEDSSDLREKLADYKKQMQQVQKEVHALLDVSEQSSHAKSDQTLQLYQQACKELEAKERVMEGMRLALSEQEDTQEQMEQVLEEKLNLNQELSSEVDKLKEMLQQQGSGNNTHQQLGNSQSDDLKRAKQEAAEAQDSVKISAEKHQADRRKWLEEKVSLTGQAKEAEDKRNQEMRKFAEDRERCTRLQSELESQLAEKEKTMENWRQERDTLVAALEVQLKRLLSSQAEKDELIQQLQQNNTQPPQEVTGGLRRMRLATLQAALSEKEAEILRLTEQLEASTVKQEDTVTQQQAENKESSAALTEKPRSETIVRKSGRKDTRASVSSQVSSGCPSVLESSEISTEEGRMSRFPRPELEISFSPLQPNRMALRRQGEEGAVTVKITRSARKRKSGEMEKEEVEAENRRNTRTKLTPKLTPHREESSSPAGRHDSQISVRSRKEGTLQKIGDFLQSSPTLLGTKAKKMMSLVSGRAGADSAASSSSLSLRAKKNKRKLYRPEISSPIDMPAHPIISREPEEKESDHQIIKRRLRSRKAK
ncbi:kinesin-like protein KIF20B [Neolamprologus brichardi]|uniref:kinesin-like protein KIF20B n=1 Tax=Neolamprologus brichardi TaxID=32507 RepID=UPI0016438DE5|nr:kinesin-like protein KIF20B [Neolamprologus brichardi]